MRVAIVGGHGQIARLLHPLLVEAGHTPVALVRNPAHRAGLEAAGVEVGLLDIEGEDADAFGRAFEGCDAVVFAAGGGPDGNKERKRTVDLEGSLKSIEGARRAGIRRFVQVSAIDVDKPVAASAGEVWAAYVEAKRDADIALRASDLDWTILRPGRLTDEPATGLVALGTDVARASVPRADVAAVLAAILDVPASTRHQWNLVAGEVPIARALTEAGGSTSTRV